MNKPKVSVLIPTYNQENYIQDCIKSVLNQNFQDFEIIVNDDFSSDNTFLKIKEIKDERIRILQPKYNQGINAALDNLIKNAQGEYSLLLGGDDMLAPNYFDVIEKKIEEHPNIDVFYCNLTPIDEKNNVRYDIKQNSLVTKEMTSIEQLRYAFMKGNFVFSTGMICKTEALNEILPLPYSIVNNQDFKMHIDMLINGKENLVLDDKLILYRIFKDKSNISSAGFYTELRESLEFEYVMESFLNITDIELLKEIFKEEIQEIGIVPYSDTIPYFLGRMAILAKKDAKKSWGYHKIVDFLAAEENFDLIKERYNLEFKDFLGLVKTFKNTTFHRCFKYKKLFNSFLIVFIISFISLLIAISSVFIIIF